MASDMKETDSLLWSVHDALGRISDICAEMGLESHDAFFEQLRTLHANMVKIQREANNAFHDISAYFNGNRRAGE